MVHLSQAAAILGMALVGSLSPVQAEQVIRIGDGHPVALDAMAAGEQALLTSRDGTLVFAGQTFDLEGFDGIAGYSADYAYLVTIRGSAQIGEQRAEPGWMFVLAPFGAVPSLQRFDAARLAASLAKVGANLPTATDGALKAITAGQRRGIFLGRLSPSTINVAAPQGAGQELAARSVTGQPGVQAIRFSTPPDPAALERKVIDAFLAALVARDADRVAALIDPMPFGNTDLRGEPGEARKAMAAMLIGRWAGSLAGAEPAPADGAAEWAVTGPNGAATVELRPLGSFIFVRSIRTRG